MVIYREGKKPERKDKTMNVKTKQIEVKKSNMDFIVEARKHYMMDLKNPCWSKVKSFEIDNDFAILFF